jgi:hypothetical protein
MYDSSWTWLRLHKWRLLLLAMVTLLAISPISEVYDRQDNLITPPTALVFLAVVFGTARERWTIWLLSALILIWLVLSIATDGSGLFAGPSLAAPVLFMGLFLAIFTLLVRWMIRVPSIDIEVIFAAICGYLLLGILWTGFYAIAGKVRMLIDPHDLGGGFSSATSHLATGDLLYFSYTTLTTTGFGDIIPRGAEVRMLAVLEAMVGVFYNTIVIARFVGLYGLGRQTQPLVADKSGADA